MRLEYHSKFKKQYKKLRPAQRKRLAEVLELFERDPHHSSLYNHPLSGDWQGYRFISFGGDWRAHYELIDEYTAFFVTCGSHSQLYK